MEKETENNCRNSAAPPLSPGRGGWGGRPQGLEVRLLRLPSSKSLSNRALLLSALSGGESHVERPSDCDDTFVMARALRERTPVIDIMAAGTSMRFLTAYFAACAGEEHVLTGSQRMKERPISVLVDALRRLGADIVYTEREGYPPLRVRGRRLQGGALALPASVSSQYISALLMTAPAMTDGLTLTLEGDIVSRPYIDMTIALMTRFGADVRWTGEREICVAPTPYNIGVAYAVESDWSAASYWYETVALSDAPDIRIVLPHLDRESLQGDSAVARFFEPLGVATEFAPDGSVVLTKSADKALPEGVPYVLDLVDQPDLAQTLVVTCALLRRPFRFTGLQSLRIKETDRMAALQNELAHLSIQLGIEGDEALYIKEYAPTPPRYDGTPIATYHDHRMAMAFAPAVLLFPDLRIAHPEVVSKSYPGFWADWEAFIGKA